MRSAINPAGAVSVNLVNLPGTESQQYYTLLFRLRQGKSLWEFQARLAWEGIGQHHHLAGIWSANQQTIPMLKIALFDARALEQQTIA